MWGVFEVNKTIHVMPVDKDKAPKQPHVTNEFCVCGPRLAYINKRIVITHNEEN